MPVERWQPGQRRLDPGEVWKTVWVSPEEVLAFYRAEWLACEVSDIFHMAAARCRGPVRRCAALA